MKKEIFANIGQASLMERLYRNDKASFKKAFNEVYPEMKGQPMAEFWNERLNYQEKLVSWGDKSEIVLVLLLSFFAGCLAKLPEWFDVNEEFYFQRNIGFIVFPMLSLYFIRKKGTSANHLITGGIVYLISVLFINAIPGNDDSQSYVLACIHLPLLLWALSGYFFLGDQWRNLSERLEYLRYNGDLVVMMALIMIAGGILSVVTIGLFELIGLQIANWYAENVMIWGAAAIPVVGTYLVLSNRHLVDKVSPVIAKVFTPLVFITLTAYLIAIFITGKDPFTDREFLIIFNFLLIGVMALIFFSIAETLQGGQRKFGILMLLGLSVVSIAVNAIALSAIIFRIFEWGMTPNKLAVLGSNVLMLVHLIIVCFRLFRGFKEGAELIRVEQSISSFLPLYAFWFAIVTFLFPFVFAFA